MDTPGLPNRRKTGGQRFDDLEFPRFCKHFGAKFIYKVHPSYWLQIKDILPLWQEIKAMSFNFDKKCIVGSKIFNCLL